ncbi:MAG: helix-turn-helix domain-containing protein [Phycisphaerae bacterium]
MARKRDNEYFKTVKAGLEDAIQWADGQKVPVTLRDVDLPMPPRPITAVQIAALRKKKVGVSQAVFAGIVNASVQTVHAWEQGRGRPSGPALRLLRLLDKHPKLVRELVNK